MFQTKQQRRYARDFFASLLNDTKPTPYEHVMAHGKYIWLQRAQPNKVQKLRRDFENGIRQAFKRTAFGICGMSVHHIIPLCYSGTNDFDNLMFVNKTADKVIHDCIRNMNPVKPYGSYNYVWLPIFDVKKLRL